MALVATVLAFVVPWLRREGSSQIEWERKPLFAVLLLDAAMSWLFVAYGGGPVDGNILLSVVLAAAGNLGFGLYLAARGFALPPVLRWSAVGLLGVVEPLLLLLGLALLRRAAGT